MAVNVIFAYVDANWVRVRCQLTILGWFGCVSSLLWWRNILLLYFSTSVSSVVPFPTKLGVHAFNVMRIRRGQVWTYAATRAINCSLRDWLNHTLGYDHFSPIWKSVGLISCRKSVAQGSVDVFLRFDHYFIGIQYFFSYFSHICFALMISFYCPTLNIPGFKFQI